MFRLPPHRSFLMRNIAGLDPPSRSALTSILQQLHLEGSPRIIIGLRKGESVPPWITHVMEIEGGTASTKRLSSATFRQHFETSSEKVDQLSALPSNNGRLLVDMRNVNVSYSNRKVGLFSLLSSIVA